MLTRRQFVSIGAVAGLGAVAGCGRGGRSESTATSIDDGRVADVTARYTAAPMQWSIAGNEVRTFGYNSLLPGPVLRATAGDLVEVTIDNQLREATSIHWHGLAIVNAMDGVPGVTQPDIASGAQFTYRFVVPDPGTYWFHPHHGLQLEHGLYAPLIINDPDEHVMSDVEYVIVLDDWLDGTGTTPHDEYERIRAAGTEMGDMSGVDHSTMEMATSPLLGGDAGDARHPYHLINGRPLEDPATLEPLPRAGDRVRLRFINASADTAYRVGVGGHRLTVTHTDGYPIEPIEVDAFLIGMGERYDVTFVVESGAWPIVALAEGKDQRGGAIVRTFDTNAGSVVRFDASELDGSWLRYADLTAHERARLDPPDDLVDIDVALTGGMMMTDWGIDGHAYGDHVPIDLEGAGGIRSTSPTKPGCGTRSTSAVTHRSSGVRQAASAKTPSTFFPAPPPSSSFRPTTPGNGCSTATTPTTLRRAWPRCCATGATSR